MGAYAELCESLRRRHRDLNRLIAAATHAHALGLRVNAGHGLNYDNLPSVHVVPHLEELNIGHSIVSRAMAVGLSKAVKEMLRLMARGHDAKSAASALSRRGGWTQGLGSAVCDFTRQGGIALG